MNFASSPSELDHPLPDPQPYVEKALRLYRTTCEDKRGKVIFLAGERGSGKSTVMAALAKHLLPANTTHTLIRGRFVEGKYVPVPSRTDEALSEKTDATGNVFAMLAKVLGLKTGLPAGLVLEGVDFLFDFVGQLLQTGVSVQRALDDISSKPPALGELSGWLKKLLRTVAEQRPVLCLLEDFDQAERIEWSDFLNSFAEEIAVDLPVMFIVSLRGGVDAGEYHPEQTHLEYSTRRLVKNGLAEWWHLAPVTQSDIATWIHLDTVPEIISELHGVTGGIPRWIVELWREWKLRETVVFNEDRQRWEWGEKNKLSMGLFKDVLEDRVKLLLKTDDLRKLDTVREILSCAALEDRTFTADALAIALEWDRDELVDFLDDNLVQTDEHPAGLLQEQPPLEIDATLQRYVCRYRFISDWHWHVLERYAFTEKQRKKRSAELLAALQRVYEDAEHFVAKPLARLCRELNRWDEAQRYELVASFSGSATAMYQHALHVVAMSDEGWDKWQCQSASRRLILIGPSIYGRYSHRELVRIYGRAAELAQRAQDDELHAHALYQCAYSHSALGQSEDAKRKALLAIDLYRKINNKSFVAAAMNLLGQLCFATGEYLEAEQNAARSLQISERLRIYPDQIVSLRLLAQIALHYRRFDEAKQKAMRALRLCERFGNLTGEVVVLGVLGQINWLQGAHDQAIQNASRALAIAKPLGLRHAAATTSSLLSDFYFEKGEYDEARKSAFEALALNAEIDSQDVHISSLFTLAKIESKQGNYEEALRRLRELNAISDNLGNEYEHALYLYLLGEIHLKKGQVELGTRLCVISYTILLNVHPGRAAELLFAVTNVMQVPEGPFNEAVGEAMKKYGTSEFEILTASLVAQALAE